MGLDVPDLDDRTFVELLEDARKRIPVYDETWTDHNVHDPGITILELLAYLAETYGYQLDQVTDVHREKYLSLAGVRRRPAEPATVQLRFGDAFEEAFEDGIVPEGTPLVAETGDGAVVRFETAAEVALTHARIEAVVAERLQSRTDLTAANETTDLHYRPFGTDADADSRCVLYLGFDADPFESTDRLELCVDFHEDSLPEPTGHGDESIEFEPSIAVDWEHCTDPERWFSDDEWETVPVRRDETNHFYGGGRVVLDAPDDWLGQRATIHDQEQYWLRCRLRLRSDRREFASNAKTSSQADRSASASSYEIPPQFDAIRTNVVPAIHRECEGEVRLVRPDDGEETIVEPGQRFEFPRAPVQDAEVLVGDDPWERVEDFDASGPTDRHYVLDGSAGAIRFGDGRHGAIPPVGEPVIAREVVYGGGRRGNVPSSSNWQLLVDAPQRPEVTPLAPPSGGRDAESIEEAFARIDDERRITYRAVTADDFEEIALHTPGLRFGRARAVVDAPDADDSGHVTVVVVPFSPPWSHPEPTAGFLDAVERHLREHALLTDRVSVVAPTYVDVDLLAEVSVVEGFEPADRQRAAIERLESFLDPLRGFEGDGWPFGRPIHTAEIYQVLEALDGIEDVRNVSVTDAGGELGAEGTTLPRARNVDVIVRSNARRRGRRT